LEITNADALPAGTSLTIGSGGGVVFDAGLTDGAAGDTAAFGQVGQPPAEPAASGAPGVAAVPEPGTLGLLAAGLAGLGIAALRQRRRNGKGLVNRLN
jgi:hypothetical protein